MPALKKTSLKHAGATGGGSRISRFAVHENLATADAKFRECWKVIKAIKSGRYTAKTGRALISFQEKLLAPISELEAMYRRIRQEQKRLIARKAAFNVGWFAKRMGALDSYREPLLHALAVGRALGDAFAWFFYERDRQLILEHHKHQRQVLLPPSDGGLGERLTLERMQGFDGKLLLYHGLTSFLRLGDVSLIDLHKMRVSCVGELKTERVAPDRINVSIDFIAGEENNLPRAPADTPRRPPERMTRASIEARRQRQIRKMGKAFSTVAAERKMPSAPLQGTFHYDALDEVVARSHRRSFEYIQVGPGLVLSAVQLLGPNETLGDLFSRRRSVNRLVEAAPGWAMKIMDQSSRDNALILGSIGGGPPELAAPAEGIPLLWWDIKPKTLERILFGEVLVVTFYNPAHLWKELRLRGFDLEFDKRHRLKRAHRLEGERVTELENFDYFHRLIHNELIRHESVVEMMDRAMHLASEQISDQPGRVDIRPVISRRPPKAE